MRIKINQDQIEWNRDRNPLSLLRTNDLVVAYKRGKG